MDRRTRRAVRLACLTALSSTVTLAEPLQPAKMEIRNEEAAYARLFELGYPADRALAVRRWRADTGRKGIDGLTVEEVAAVLSQPMPEFFAAFAGNPFQGLGIAVRHKTRSAAEAQAVELCRQQKGGAACREFHVIPGGQCMFASGYHLPAGDRRPSRASFAIALEIEFARQKSFEMCSRGALATCRPILSFCADGSRLVRF
jgi:hypothetical protein